MVGARGNGGSQGFLSTLVEFRLIPPSPVSGNALLLDGRSGTSSSTPSRFEDVGLLRVGVVHMFVSVEVHFEVVFEVQGV
jgi:hypothetical protein